MPGRLSYFVADTHLGLDVLDAPGREDRFVSFLRSLDIRETENLFLLGDIFDFWYEYKYVVPKGFSRVIAALEDLVRSGVKVFFFRGNHDVWTYHYFQSLGLKVLDGPEVITVAGTDFCLAHGDALGPVPTGSRILSGIFHSKLLQALFSTLHPRIAFSFGRRWSKGNRISHGGEYSFKGKDEPLYSFAASYPEKVDYFVFGHYHASWRGTLPSGAEMIVLKDWFRSSPYGVFDASTGVFTVEG